MKPLHVPVEIEDVFNNYLTCEFTTLGRQGMPVTWPVLPIFWAERGQFIIMTSIGLPQKAFNVRRDRRVSLLFSEPTGSGLDQPPAVLVQGEAEAPDKILVSPEDFGPELTEMMKPQILKLVQNQPSMSLYLLNPITRYLMDWYFIRLMITITPKRIEWWPRGDCNHTPSSLEVAYVV
jgi:hypothetical protein